MFAQNIENKVYSAISSYEQGIERLLELQEKQIDLCVGKGFFMFDINLAANLEMIMTWLSDYATPVSGETENGPYSGALIKYPVAENQFIEIEVNIHQIFTGLEANKSQPSYLIGIVSSKACLEDIQHVRGLLSGDATKVIKKEKVERDQDFTPFIEAFSELYRMTASQKEVMRSTMKAIYNLENTAEFHLFDDVTLEIGKQTFKDFIIDKSGVVITGIPGNHEFVRSLMLGLHGIENVIKDDCMPLELSNYAFTHIKNRTEYYVDGQFGYFLSSMGNIVVSADYPLTGQEKRLLMNYKIQRI